MTINTLSKVSAVNLLISFKCHKKGTNYSIAELILNKLTPLAVDLEKISELDIFVQHTEFN